MVIHDIALGERTCYFFNGLLCIAHKENLIRVRMEEEE
jgi:hypothetical protein